GVPRVSPPAWNRRQSTERWVEGGRSRGCHSAAEPRMPEPRERVQLGLSARSSCRRACAPSLTARSHGAHTASSRLAHLGLCVAEPTLFNWFDAVSGSEAPRPAG